MKKINKLLLKSFMIMVLTILPVVSVGGVINANTPTTSENQSSEMKKFIRTDGVFTKAYDDREGCGNPPVYEVDIKPPEERDGISLNPIDMIESLIDVAITSIFTTVNEWLFKADCEPSDAVDLSGGLGTKDSGNDEGDNGSGLGLMKQMMIFSNTINITNIPMLMLITGIFQTLALVLVILYFLHYGYKVMNGTATRGDNTSIVKQFLKIGVVMYAIYAAPYLLQDILGIGNTITKSLSSMNLKLNLGSTSLTETSATFELRHSLVVLMNILFLELYSITSTMGSGLPGGTLLFSGLLVIIISIVMFIPLVRLIIWWYTRMFKIFIYTAISPFMFMTFAGEGTQSTGKNFVMSFVRTVLEQVFVVVGLAVTVAFMNSITTVAGNLGLIGYIIAFYTSIKFLGQVPQMAAGMIEGRAEGDARASIGGIGFAGAAMLGRRYGGKAFERGKGFMQNQRFNREVRSGSGSFSRRVDSEANKIEQHQRNVKKYGANNAEIMRKARD